MRKVILAAGLYFSCSLASATVINFDVDGLGAAIPGNTPITNQYSNLGVLFEGLENGSSIDINAAPDPDGIAAPSPPNVMTNCSNANLTCPGNRADIVRITFDSAVTGVSLMLDSLGSLSVTFNLYDNLDVLLETQTVTSGGSLYVPVGFAATNVSRIDGLQPNDGWAWAFDDLTFEPSGVPEPTTLALMGLGLAGIGYRRHRTKKAA